MSLYNELSDIVVVSLEQAVAAPYCGLLLADAGARVIKVERPEGDFARSYDNGANGESSIFAWLNRGKESICLNLKDKKDKSLLLNIIQKADILLSNLLPGAIDRMELSGKILRKKNPGIITCKISGYGDSDLAEGKKAYDFLVQAESGLCSITGSEECPSKVGISVTDISTGLTAYSAILRSLIRRGKTGKGVDISISMFDVMADWMNMPLLAHRYMSGAPKRTGLKHSFISPYGSFKCRDGKQILLSIQNNREFRVFCEQVLKMPELYLDENFSDNPVRFLNRDMLDEIISCVFSQFNLEEVVDILNKSSIANAKLNSVEDLSNHIFLKNSKAKIGGQTISIASLPVKNNFQSNFQVPALGEHNKKIIKEFQI